MEEKVYPRRHGILAALFIALLALQYAMLIPGGAALTVMGGYAISPILFSIVMTIPYLSGVLFGVFAGTLGDRVGIGKIVLIGFGFAIVGAVMRALSQNSYALLLISTFLIGFATAALNANSAKLIRLWFPGNSNATAMGLYVAGATIGAIIAIQVGARCATLATLWWSSVVVLIIAIVCWLIFYRKHPLGEQETREPLKEHLGAVLKNKSVWVISLFAFFFMGSTVTNASYFIAGYSALAGVNDAVTAANITSINGLVATITSVALVPFIAKFSRLRPPLVFLLAVTGISFCLILFVPVGPLTWVISIIEAFFMGPVLAMCKTLPVLIPSVEKKHLGAVGGVQSMFQNMGFFLLTTYILSPIALAIDPTSGLAFYRAVYVGTGIACFISLILLFFLPNLRASVSAKIDDEMAAKGDGPEYQVIP